MATNKELEEKVLTLERELQEAVRRFAEKVNSSVSVVAKLNEEVATLKAELKKTQQTVANIPKNQHNASINRYE